MWLWIHKLASPKRYYQLANRLIPWFTVITVCLMLSGLLWGLIWAPTDYLQSETYRIMYIHVPAAWMSMFVYMVMAITSIIAIIWRIKLAEIVAKCSAPLGASFTLIALLTGMIWGKPTWGTWWVWEGRLTSELILLFLYMGFIALHAAVDEPRKAARMSGILAIVGMVNIPIIHYSVIWWNSLHQGPSVSKLDTPSIHISMLIPLLIMALAFKFYYFVVLMVRTQNEILQRERNTQWVSELMLK